jgi:glucosamine-6-phosphate deaminase
MNLTVTNSYEQMSKEAASFLVRIMSQKEKVNIGLATGNTPTKLYEVLLGYLDQGFSMNHVQFFNIDEYCGVTGKEPGTCRYYLEEHFFAKTAIPKENIHWLTEDEADTYDALLASFGGLDAIILGIGENGHIAYNEPNTSFSSHTHIVDLTDASKKQHSQEFGGFYQVPDQAVTMGIKTIMQAKHILLIANGSKKKDILTQALFGSISEENPASILQLHPQLYVCTDQPITSE